ncbi:MAG TPA: BrnA antitoxin family protein [Rubrivivax sp.]|nr:BrnA antitoxin family protein [Rubrivivax sp.]
MSKRTPLTDAGGEVRELTAEDLAGFKPAKDALPAELYARLVAMNRRAGVRGPQKSPVKVPTTIRMDPEALARWRASGPGWQTRAAALLAAKAPK